MAKKIAIIIRNDIECYEVGKEFKKSGEVVKDIRTTEYHDIIIFESGNKIIYRGLPTVTNEPYEEELK